MHLLVLFSLRFMQIYRLRLSFLHGGGTRASANLTKCGKCGIRLAIAFMVLHLGVAAQKT